MEIENKKQTFLPETKFLSLIAKSREKFIKEYKKYDEDTAKNVYRQTFTELVKSISNGNLNYFKNLCNVIEYISSITKQEVLKEYYDHTDNSTNVVILICQHQKIEMLEHLFHIENTILSNLSVDVGVSILPNSKDNKKHNAFYYAISKGNIALLDALITKWPRNYFASNAEILDEVLSETCEELKLKSIPLSDKMKIFVENKLINLRFFSNGQNTKTTIDNIKHRIKLLVDNINLLNAEYHTKNVDDRFIFVAKFVAQNIHILKRQLKSTYDRLPWEEVEFCLISFTSSQTKQQEMNVFYRITLNKTKMLKYLENFAKKLQDQTTNIENVGIKVISKLPSLSRKKVAENIILNNPEFGELYSDYQKIMDVYSLQKISDCIKLALSADPNEMQGHFVITRVLQVIGEYLKNTLESPKLSDATSERLLFALPKNTRNVIIDLRNSLSHASALLKRTEIEENTNVKYFIGIQNDLKVIDDVINDILGNIKIDTCIMLLTKIINCKDLKELQEIGKILPNFDVFKLVPENSQTLKEEKYEKLVKKLINCIPEKTSSDLMLLKRIEETIGFYKKKSKTTSTDYFSGVGALYALNILLNETKMNNDIFKGVKFAANQALANITSKMDPKFVEEFQNTTLKILRSVILRLKDDNNDELNRIFFEIFYLSSNFESNIKWIDGLRDKFYEKSTNKPKSIPVEEQLAQKLTQLKSILHNNSLGSVNEIMEKYSEYKKNKELQAAIEMLVLDIMSILDNNLENNLLFLEAPSPLLIGKCLRNHLAHYNTLVDLLLVDPSTAILLNANKLTEANIIKNKKKIGLSAKDDPVKLKIRYEHDLAAIANQQRMFEALEEGNLETVKECIKNGANINSKNFNSWPSLHLAAKGPSLEVVKFVLDHNSNIENVDGRKPLHVAAAHGRQNIVEYFIKKLNLPVNDLGENGKRPLHFAVMNGHKGTVEVLLKHNADVAAKDLKGLSALHYAIDNNHIDITKILLEKDSNVDINETLGGYTALHTAAERGHVKLVKFLLDNNANVNAKTDKEWIPLHAASFNGHIEVVNALIEKGADVNACLITGCSSLHFAVEKGHETVADILLKHKAIVNVFDKTYKNSPLHYASKDGHEGIALTLLKHKANVNAATVEGMTPLHFASEGGHMRIVIALIQHGAEINAKNILHCTPLHLAAINGHTKITEILIHNNANICAVTAMGATPLYAAAHSGQADIIEILIKHKSDVNSSDYEGKTPLHAAASIGSLDAINLLVKNKANVNARSLKKYTPLYEAVSSGNIEAVQLLLQNNATVNNEADIGPLHLAVKKGYKDIVNLLIENKAQINNKLLHVAVKKNHKEIALILIKHGVDVNAKLENISPLSCAVKCNHKEIVELLLANGANISIDCDGPLLFATMAGYADIVKLLLNKTNGDCKFFDDSTALHLAALKGHTKIVNELIRKGVDVNVLTKNNSTPLHFAVVQHEDIVELLISNGANVNAVDIEGSTPIHLAASNGHNNIVKILLENAADINVRDKKNRIPLELAVARNHFQVVKTLLQYAKHDLNRQDHNVGTVLHIAASESNLDIVKYLVNAGCDIHARNISGSKPIHIAAREGFKDIVDFFLNKGLSIDDPGIANQTLIHYAASKGQLEIVKHLILLNVDINAKDANGQTAVHIASRYGYKNIIEILLNHGAIYNPLNNFGLKPVGMTEDENIIKLFTTIDKLFKSVKGNNLVDVKECIKSGVLLSAKNNENGIPLHYAAWKGYDDIVQTLLQNKSNPNAVGNNGYTPLHYAAKFSHLSIVKILLSNGAVYNAVSDSGKTPMDFAEDTNIINLLKFVSEAFKNVEKNNSKIINDINKIKDIDKVRAIMSARNRENNTLVVAAMRNNFTKINQLKHIQQGDVESKINEAYLFLETGDSQKALKILTNLFDKSKDILGEDSPGTLDIQSSISKVYYKQGNYVKALKLLEEIYEKQKEMLGPNNEDTLCTRSSMALILHRQGKDEEALQIFQDVYDNEKVLLPPGHPNILSTQLHMALVLDRLGKYDEALEFNKRVFHYYKEVSGTLDPTAIRAQNNIAMVLGNQGKTDKALKIYREVYEKKKKVFGPNHADTLRTLYNIALHLQKQEKYHESLHAFEEILSIQKKNLGPFHPDTLNTQESIGNVLFVQGKWIRALKAYKECLNQKIIIFGANNPSVLQMQKHIEIINMRLQFEGSNEAETLLHLQKEINIAANDGDFQTIQRLIKSGADLNVQDTDGRTPLHFAVNNKHLDIIKLLLKNNADPTIVTNKGNTILHTAAKKGFEDIVSMLLKHVKGHFNGKFNSFIDAKTINGGTTALHVASQNSFIQIVKCLMEFGAIYNSIDYTNNKAPLHVASEPNIIRLLTLTEELFEDAQNGKIEIIAKLQNMKRDEFAAVTNARNNQGNTLLQTMIHKKHKDIARKLLNILKN